MTELKTLKEGRREDGDYILISDLNKVIDQIAGFCNITEEDLK